MGRVAVLSYHGWEIDPGKLTDDVRSLRRNGWHDCSLADLEAMAAGRRACEGSYFHVTLDDGAEQDVECVEALSRLSCAVTLFLPLDVMSEAARFAHHGLLSRTDGSVVIGDHSLRHNRTFQSRRVIGFHCDEAPLMTSPDRMGLQSGDPVCAYGGELARPRFLIDSRAREHCRAAAGTLKERPGTDEWTEALASVLIEAGLGFRRFGRLCVAGQYEPRNQFKARISPYLLEGRDRLTAFTGRTPIAFAHPWWQPSPTADDCLQSLGYRLTFSGRGLWRARKPFGIPRVFVHNEAARPLMPERAAEEQARSSFSAIRDLGRRTLWA